MRAVFGASAALLQAFTYAAYGELLAVHSTTGQSVPVAQALTRMLYSGEATDPNTGMQYLRARWYDTNSGRFATLDPHGGVFENPLTMNKYAYTSGDPISYNDPTGEFEGLAGMMGSMGNMMANFGMRMSQGLRMMKLARNLQRYVKMFQKLINFIENVESFMSMADSVEEFMTGGLGFPPALTDVLNDLSAYLGSSGSSGSSGGATAAMMKSSSTASSAASAAASLIEYKVYRKTFSITQKADVDQLNYAKGKYKNFGTKLKKGVKFVIIGAEKLFGKNKVGEWIGEFGAKVAFSMMGFNSATGAPHNLEMEKRPGGIDLLMTSGTFANQAGISQFFNWAIIEAKGMSARRAKESTKGYGRQMTAKWIEHNMDELIRKNGPKASDLQKAWKSEPFLATIISTKFASVGTGAKKSKQWVAKGAFQIIRGPKPDGSKLRWPKDM